ILHLERNNLAAGEESLEVPLHDFLDWRAAQKSFESLAAYYDGTMNLSGGEDKPERFSGGFLTANTFEVLRVKPILGRDFLPGEDAPGAEPVAILSHDLWQQRFHGDPAIVGKAIRINGISRTVVGVMPEGFLFPLREKLWMPLPLDTSKIKRGEGTTLEVIGRIRSGLTLAQARAEFSGIAERLAHQYPDTNKGVGSVVKPFTEEYIDDEPRQLLYTMLTAVFGVLLIACANVANLLLARTALRSREVAVSSALGASRGRIITQILSEAFLLALPGALLGLLIAQWGVELFNQALLPADPPFWIHIRVDYGVLLFVLGLALLSALVAGLTPALQASGRKAGEVLKDESRGSSGFRIGRISRTLVIAEVALSFGLLVAAGLTVKSVVELRNRNWGFETHHLYTSRMALFPQDYPEAPQRAQFFRELLERVQALPEVKSAAIVDSLPVLGSGGDYIAIEGQEHAANEYPTARLSTVSPAYFDTVGVKAVAGRLFDDHDREGSTPVVLINQSMAKQFFAKTSPLGQRLRWPANDPKAAFRTIVGVVPDLFMRGPRNREPAGFYMPLAQGDLAFANVIARTTSAPMDIAPAVQRSVNAIDANM
nr:ABC transporter permease [Thermoanaerobaculia bacterium]